MDSIDRKIIRTLQQDGRISNQELSETVNLSPSPCLRRLRQLEKSGVITGYAARIDAEAYGLPLLVFVRVTLANHSEEVIHKFENAIDGIEEVVECFLLTGSADYLLRIMVADLRGYERFVREKLQPIGGIGSIDSGFVYSTVKSSPLFPRPD